MKKVKYIMMAVLCALCATACQDDYFENQMTGADTSRPVKVSLSFGTPRSTEVTVTKADNSNSGLFSNGIRIYVFNTDGTYLGTQDFARTDLHDSGENDSENGRTYTASNVSLYVGTQRVYALANFSQSGYFSGAENLLSTLETAAEAGESTFLEQLYNLSTRTSDNNTFPSFSTDVMPLSGVGDITVTAGSQQANGEVKLERLVAQVKFIIHTEATYREDGIDYKVTFTPQTFTFHNLPKQGFVLGNDARETVISGGNFYDSGSNDIDPASEETNQTTFSRFVPESIQKMKQTTGNDYDKREAFSSQNGDVKTWTYAPQNGMYVVLRGRYEETHPNTGALHKSADVEYTIHLGDFSTDKDNYNVERNTIYTYTVRVEGVHNIIVEAEKEDLGDDEYQNSAEGDVIELDQASQVFNLDAHYEQVYVDYNLSDVVEQLRAQVAQEPESPITEERLKELIAGNFILSFRSPFNTAGNKVVRPYYNVVNGVEVADETEAMEGIDYQWVEFYPQSSENAISEYPGTGDPDLLSPWLVCKEMGEVVRVLYGNGTPNQNDYHITLSRSGYNSGDWIARFTVFVNEYYYQKDLAGNTVSWDSFANKENRVMMVASDMKISADNNSTYSTARTYISQASIQTFYYQGRDNAMGLETYNENGLITNPGSPVSTATDWVNGRENMILNICGQRTLPTGYNRVRWSGYGSGRYSRDYIDWTEIGYTSPNSVSGNEPGYYNSSSAYYACLSRNRDLNSDGYIDENELRWYQPALSQYMRIGIGTMALSADARLFQGSKDDMTKTGYDNGSYAQRGTFYYVSDSQRNFYWAVELGAFGTTMGSPVRAHVRCVRNLPGTQLVAQANNSNEEAPVGDEALGEPIYEEVKQIYVGSGYNYLFDFGDRLAPQIFRNSDQPQQGPYASHHNEQSDANRLPNAFVLAKRYIPEENSDDDQLYTSLSVVHDRNTDPCNDYYETEADRGLWRTPNLSELMILTQAESTHREYWGSELNLLKTNGYSNTYCSTEFSNRDVRAGFIFQSSRPDQYTIRNIVTAPDKDDSSSGYIRCVRDATQAEREAAQVVN